MNATERKFAVGIGVALVLSIASFSIQAIPALRLHFFQAAEEERVVIFSGTSDHVCHTFPPESPPLSARRGDTLVFVNIGPDTIKLNFPNGCPFNESCSAIDLGPYGQSSEFHPKRIAATAVFRYTIDDISSGNDCTPLNGVGIKIQK